MRIRAESAGDATRIWLVNAAAFPDNTEANLVDRLRQRTTCISLVATGGDDVVGHILFTPVELEGHAELSVAGLAPMAVLPEEQNRGIGTQLVQEGIRRCRDRAIDAIVVLGHKHYYPRFGFVPASRYAIKSEFDVPDDVFMILQLTPGGLDGVSGLVRYDPAFSDV